MGRQGRAGQDRAGGRAGVLRRPLGKAKRTAEGVRVRVRGTLRSLAGWLVARSLARWLARRCWCWCWLAAGTAGLLLCFRHRAIPQRVWVPVPARWALGVVVHCWLTAASAISKQPQTPLMGERWAGRRVSQLAVGKFGTHASVGIGLEAVGCPPTCRQPWRWSLGPRGRARISQNGRTGRSP